MLASNAPSPKQNKKPYVISKGRKFEKARGRRKSRGAFIISIACTSRNIDTDSLDLHHRLQGQLSAFFLFCCCLVGWFACSGISLCNPTARSARLEGEARRAKDGSAKLQQSARLLCFLPLSCDLLWLVLPFDLAIVERSAMEFAIKTNSMGSLSACTVLYHFVLRLSAAGSASRVDSFPFRSNSKLRPKELVRLPLIHYRSIPSTGSCRWPP